MRTQTILILFAMTSFVAFGLFVSSLANAEQTAIGPFTLLTAPAGSGPANLMLIKHGSGGGSGGGKAFHSGMHHSGNHFRNRGFYTGFYPDYYGDSYTSSPNCVWNGYKFVCYNMSDDYVDVY